MCRAGGRRCDAKWGEVSRKRYNARRRVTRNAEKAEAARAAGDEAKAGYYDRLASSAGQAAATYDAVIQAHETQPENGPAEAVDYRVGHTAPSDDGYSKPITNLTDGFFGDDVYDHPDWYGTADDETMEQLKAVRDDPDATVRVYRAVPSAHQEINGGDWVTLSKDYAETHSYDLEGDGKDGTVVSMDVPASQVFTDGNDLAEYGYSGPSTQLGDPAGGASQCPDCGQWAGPGHTCSRGPTAAPPQAESSRHPLASQDAEPMDLDYIRNPQSLAGNQAANHDFGQDVEPSGRYMTQGEGVTPDGWESGRVRFEKPLHMGWGETGSYATDDNWKRRLSAHYGGKTGSELSHAIRDDGYDGIVTHDKYGTSEIVDLTHLSPTPTSTHDQDGSQGPEQCPDCGRWVGSGHDCPQRATREELRSVSQGWRDSWSDDETEAFDSYSSIEHAGINQKLRDGHELTRDEAAAVAHLDSLTERAPRTEQAHTLYRGIGFAESARGEQPGREWVAENCREGHEIEFASFTSTTTTRETAEYFSGARSEHVTSGVIFEVETTQAGYTKDSAEDEVLLGRGSRFEVISSGEEVEVEGKPYQQVRLREVEPATSASSPGWDQGAQHSPKEAKDFGAHLESKHGVTMHLSGKSDSDSYVTLHHIEVPEGQRGSGAGKAAMRDLVEEADRNGWKLDLTPAGDYGGNVPRLKRFYKGFGFVENKGRNKDYASRETFVRAPKGA